MKTTREKEREEVVAAMEKHKISLSLEQLLEFYKEDTTRAAGRKRNASEMDDDDEGMNECAIPGNGISWHKPQSTQNLEKSRRHPRWPLARWK